MSPLNALYFLPLNIYHLIHDPQNWIGICLVEVSYLGSNQKLLVGLRPPPHSSLGQNPNFYWKKEFLIASLTYCILPGCSMSHQHSGRTEFSQRWASDSKSHKNIKKSIWALLGKTDTVATLTFWRQEEMHREYENTELNVKWFEKIFLRTFLGSSLSSWLHWGGVGSTGSKRRVSKCYKRIKYKHYKNQRYNSWKYYFTLLFKKKL